MKNQIELRKMMWDVQNEITTMKENLKNSKDYLIYLNDCLKEIEKQEVIEKENQRLLKCENYQNFIQDIL
jgi:hypothetical protein